MKTQTRGYVHLVGIGPGDESYLTLGAIRAIREASEIWCQELGPKEQERAFVRKLLAGKKVVNANSLYQVANLDRRDIYRQVAERVAHLAMRGRQITFLWSGNPLIWVDTPVLLKELARPGGFELRITPGVSFLDVIWIDAPIHGKQFQVRLGGISDPDIQPDIDCVAGQVGDTGTTRLTSASAFTRFFRDLRRQYPPSHPVFVTGAHPKHGGKRSELTTVRDLPKVLPTFEDWFYSIIIPARPQPASGKSSRSSSNSRR